MKFRWPHAVLAVLVLLTPGAAHAAEAPPFEWPHTSICTQARITSARANPTPTATYYVITGNVLACPGAEDPLARWTVAYYYRTGGLGTLAHPMPYSPDGFHFLFRRMVSTDTWAACVVNDVRPADADPSFGTANRVACVAPDPTVDSSVPVPVPVDDPRFDGALLLRETAGPRPACANCV